MAQTTSILNGGITINEIHPFPNVDHDGDGDHNFDDLYIELYNTSGGPIDISGFEILGFAASQNNFIVQHTFAQGTVIPAGGRITVVDSENGGNNVTNVTGPGVLSDDTMWFADAANIFLFAPATATHPNGSYIVVGGSSDGFFAEDLQSFQAIHPNATQIGSTERTPSNPGDGPNSLQRVQDGEDSFVTQTATPGSANCFLTGTLIATPTGERRVEELVIGDLVRTADGREVAVRWNGRQSLKKLRVGLRMQPVRFRAHALGDGVPYSDLIVTADHGMMIDGLVINAAALVNGTSIDWVPMAALPAVVTYYHIETEHHDVILANGAPTETFVDYVGRQAFDNCAEYIDLYGAERIIREMDAPRISAARLVPPAIRARLGMTRGAIRHSIGLAG